MSKGSGKVVKVTALVVELLTFVLLVDDRGKVQVSEGRCSLRHVAWLLQKCCGVLRSGGLVVSLASMVVCIQRRRRERFHVFSQKLRGAYKDLTHSFR